jgi:hypothetical protein
MLLTESAHLSNALIFGSHVTPVPKGYLYFDLFLVEVINMKAKRKKSIRHKKSSFELFFYI